VGDVVDRFTVVVPHRGHVAQVDRHGATLPDDDRGHVSSVPQCGPDLHPVRLTAAGESAAFAFHIRSAHLLHHFRGRQSGRDQPHRLQFDPDLARLAADHAGLGHVTHGADLVLQPAGQLSQLIGAVAR
jgi:hypothetical protein